MLWRCDWPNNTRKTKAGEGKIYIYPAYKTHTSDLDGANASKAATARNFIPVSSRWTVGGLLWVWRVESAAPTSAGCAYNLARVVRRRIMYQVYLMVSVVLCVVCCWGCVLCSCRLLCCVVLCCVVQCWWLVASSSVSVRGIFSYYFRTWEIWEKTLGLKEWDNKINTR